jgi:hypothetical protein
MAANPMTSTTTNPPMPTQIQNFLLLRDADTIPPVLRARKPWLSDAKSILVKFGSMKTVEHSLVFQTDAAARSDPHPLLRILDAAGSSLIEAAFLIIHAALTRSRDFLSPHGQWPFKFVKKSLPTSFASGRIAEHGF